MLKELYDYAMLHKLVPPYGYINQAIGAVVHLDKDGVLMAAQKVPAGTTICAPDIGTAKNSGNGTIFVASRDNVLTMEENKKSIHFRTVMAEAAKTVPAMAACCRFLANEKEVNEAKEQLDALKVNEKSQITFFVDGVYIMDAPGANEWWQDYRPNYFKVKNLNKSICLVTGKMTFPTLTHGTVGSVNGNVGASAYGAKLISMNAPAFESFGLKQGENCCVSAEAGKAIDAALEHLCQNAPIVAGMKFVHWFSNQVEDDVFNLIDYSRAFLTEAEEVVDKDPAIEKEKPEERKRRIAISANQKANELIDNLIHGKITDNVPKGTRYYMMLVSGSGARIVIRSFEEGDYSELAENFRLWYTEMQVEHQKYIATTLERKCDVLCTRYFKFNTMTYSDRENAKNKELAFLLPQLFDSLLHNLKLPDAVATKALHTIKSEIARGNYNSHGVHQASEWLKLWLIRRDRSKNIYTYNEEEWKVNELNMSELERNERFAYCAGALLANYARVQKVAIKNVGTDIISRNFGSAIQAPALTFARLTNLYNHHKSKIKAKWLVNTFQNRIDELYGMMDQKMPMTLDTVGQAYFALGFNQENGRIWAELSKAKEKHKSDSNNEETEKELATLLEDDQAS